MLDRMTRIGIAGWAVPKRFASGAGSHLEKYSRFFNAVEINSSFYRPHRLETYQRWAHTVPDDFRFSVKLPKAITHEAGLVDCEEALREFVEQTSGLGEKLGIILVQLPRTLEYEKTAAQDFFARLRDLAPCPAACEPRHASWFEPSADAHLRELGVARVAAHPLSGAKELAPGGDLANVYFRLHGAPRMYYSRYDEPFLEQVAQQMTGVRREARECWCIFDNTAETAAWDNALEMQSELRALEA